MKHRLIIDCDPGQDDAVMLLMALAWPEKLELLGVCAVAGNVPLALTQRNTRMICELAGRADLPVFAGCEAPLQRQLHTAEHVHGSSGLDGLALWEPALPLQEQHAVHFLIETLLDAEPESITLVPTGPLTNIAMALQKEPAITRGIRNIVLMGGAMREAGNITPSAEFNIYVDPHAAQTVLTCGRPLVVAGLDVTHQVPVPRAWLQTLQNRGDAVAEAVAAMLTYYNRFDTEKYGSEGAPLHDPCTIAWLLEPQLFTGRDCHIAVETESALTLGHTAVDFWQVTSQTANAHWLHAVDADGFFHLLDRSLKRYAI